MPSKLIKDQKKRAPNKTDLEGLTQQQQLFVAEAIADPEFNLCNAAKRAGSKCPARQAPIWMRNKVIQRAIGSAMWQRMHRCEISADRVLRELMCIGFFDPKELFDSTGMFLPVHEMPEEARRAIQSIKVSYKLTPAGRDEDGNLEYDTIMDVEVKFWNKNEALRLIGDHMGMWDPRLNDMKKLSENVGNLATVLQQVEQNRRNVITSEVIDVVAKATSTNGKENHNGNSNGKF